MVADLEAFGSPIEVSLSRTIRANNSVLKGHLRRVARTRADTITDLAAVVAAAFSKEGGEKYVEHVRLLIRASH